MENKSGDNTQPCGVQFFLVYMSIHSVRIDKISQQVCFLVVKAAEFLLEICTDHTK